jgi:hypothetical protein
MIRINQSNHKQQRSSFTNEKYDFIVRIVTYRAVRYLHVYILYYISAATDPGSCVWCVYIQDTRRVVQSVGHESSNSCNLGTRLVIHVLLPTLFNDVHIFVTKLLRFFGGGGLRGSAFMRGSLSPPLAPPLPPRCH